MKSLSAYVTITSLHAFHHRGHLPRRRHPNRQATCRAVTSGRGLTCPDLPKHHRVGERVEEIGVAGEVDVLGPPGQVVGQLPG
jgi:hypothetical protein